MFGNNFNSTETETYSQPFYQFILHQYKGVANFTVFEKKKTIFLEILLLEISFGKSRQNDFNCTFIHTDLLDLYCNIDVFFSETSI